MFSYIYGGKMSAIVYLFHFHDFINTRLYGILNVFWMSLSGIYTSIHTK